MQKKIAYALPVNKAPSTRERKTQCLLQDCKIANLRSTCALKAVSCVSPDQQMPIMKRACWLYYFLASGDLRQTLLCSLHAAPIFRVIVTTKSRNYRIGFHPQWSLQQVLLPMKIQQAEPGFITICIKEEGGCHLPAVPYSFLKDLSHHFGIRALLVYTKCFRPLHPSLAPEQALCWEWFLIGTWVGSEEHKWENYPCQKHLILHKAGPWGMLPFTLWCPGNSDSTSCIHSL